ncbi:hypothetical protein [Streptomyces sp. NPDC048349]|uniref:hypothetical protein n=1 Tax=Streptomyces sp. NPDC048349 TaxID=3155486 RepID=UPI00342F9098
MITSEFDGWADTDGVPTRDRLDVLGLDATGRLVVVELERGIADRDVHLQAISYATLVNRFDLDTLAERTTTSGGRGEDEIRKCRGNGASTSTPESQPRKGRIVGAFATPELQEFVNTFGVEPVITGDGQCTVDFTEVVDGKLELSYDATGRSVAVTWHPEQGDSSFTIFREGATLLRIIDGPESSKVTVDFSTSDTVGNIEIQVLPKVTVSDRTLLC